uniref:Nuclease associated modular domain-containing protein n=1 Tax=Leersia perrieri TaxID=77586 RepID=A0A0D9WKE6_9ORYZ
MRLLSYLLPARFLPSLPTSTALLDFLLENHKCAAVQGRKFMAAAAIQHCARAGMPPMNFQCGANSSSRITFSCYKYCAALEPSLKHYKFQEHRRLIQYREFVLPQSSLKEQACEQLVHDMDEQWSHHSSYSQPFTSTQPSTIKRNVEKIMQDHSPCQTSILQGDVHTTGLSMKEIERRRKIGAANKGKIPWTKGRKLSKEHKELIKQRTTEALRDLKVRQKMLGHRQLHRQASKDKISDALRKIWERRIVSVKARQEVLQIWSNNIAQAAKQGDHCQDTLDWDSYDRIKSEMISMYLWNKEKERIVKKLRKAEAKIIAKKVQAAEKSKLQTRGAKKLRCEKLVLRKSDAQPTRVVVSTRPKLKERLTKSKANGSIQKAGKVNHTQGGGSNWVLVAGGVLLSTLSVKLGCKLKQMFDTKKQNCSAPKALADGVEVKQPPGSPLPKSTDPSSLLLVKIPGPESSKENSGVMWTSSPDRLEDPRKPFQYSNSSGSPCFSESGSDIYNKREVIQKLRQHLKRRDEMIMEMQAQIADLKNSLGTQVTQTSNLQSQLDAANRDLFESEREIQHLRKIIADHCVAEALSHDKPLQAGHWQSDATNGHVNGYADSSVDGSELHCISVEKRKGEVERVEMLKREVGELKEVVEGKDFVIQSYKEQKLELCSKIRELQEKLSAQVPNIL